jgi:hypothetical protein
MGKLLEILMKNNFHRQIEENEENEEKRTWKGCCYITVDFATTVLQNGACTYRCISKQMNYKTPISHNG